MAQEMAMLHDIARCSACRACMVACKQWHDLPADMSTPFEGQYQSHATLTPTTWNLIRMTERTDAKGKFHWDFVKVQCMHCGDPACAKGCPEEAIDKLDSGAVVINADKCVGCGYCVANCPFDVPKINKETHKSTKCDLCFDRIEEGMTPSCAKTCTAAGAAGRRRRQAAGQDAGLPRHLEGRRAPARQGRRCRRARRRARPRCRQGHEGQERR